jgi:CHASE2 domain-containing sensor protein
MIRYLFRRDTILATLMVFALIGLLALIPLNTHVLDPFKLALQDFDYNDLAYSKMEKNKNTALDTNIVIVNVGQAKRPQIAEMIKKVQEQHPLVIGVDVTFKEPKTPAEDSLLMQVSRSPETVMAYEMVSEGHHLKPAGFLFAQTPDKGYVNIWGEEGGVNRDFLPVVKQDGHEYLSFAAAILRKANPASYQKLLSRGRSKETINYKRRDSQYQVIEGDALMMGTDSFPLANKIVLVGYISPDPNNVEDKLFTPMNARSFGKSLPDMNGVVVHANIINMILEADYISKMPAWITWGIALVVCWIHMAVFLAFAIERHLWFHLLSKIAQIVSAIAFIYIGLYTFYAFNLKINLVPTFVAIILAVDVLYFYEAICNWMHHRYRLPSVFHNPNTKHKHK